MCGSSRRQPCLSTPVSFGLDPDPDAIGRARRGGAHERLFQASADHIPLPDGACDPVVANSVLEHIPDPEPALAEIWRVLRTGGHLVMTAPGERFGEDIGLVPVPARTGGLRDSAPSVPR